ncbi:High-affinity branched-chain amino acid transport system permease protein LivH [compost metagenome]
MPGAVLGGLIIGLSEAAAVQLVGAEWRAAISFVLLMAVLFIRPIGLFGVKER